MESTDNEFMESTNYELLELAHDLAYDLTNEQFMESTSDNKHLDSSKHKPMDPCLTNKSMVDYTNTCPSSSTSTRGSAAMVDPIAISASTASLTSYDQSNVLEQLTISTCFYNTNG
jgi:hypothetical protein